MNRNALPSRAFTAAALRSEKYRITGLLWFLVAAVLIVAVRIIVAESAAEREALIQTGILVFVIMAYEGLMFRFITRSIETDHEPAS